MAWWIIILIFLVILVLIIAGFGLLGYLLIESDLLDDEETPKSNP